jgi:3'(2'), 5'-bisphosphate nucleotidase
MNLTDLQIEDVLAIARSAGAAIMKIYEQDFAIETKADNSPLTAADRAGNAVIIEGLEQLFPAVPIISEETKLIDFSVRKDWEWCWVVDPLDGTKEFIKKNGEFTVNIALVHNNEPVAGVVYVPAQDKMFYAVKGEGAYLESVHGAGLPLHVRPLAQDGILKVVGSRSHNSPEVDAYVDTLRAKYPNVEFVAAGSSLKFCLLAEGKADVYPRLAPTMEWDTCAGQIVATEAGAEVLRFPEWTPLDYNKENLLNPHFVVRHPDLS